MLTIYIIGVPITILSGILYFEKIFAHCRDVNKTSNVFNMPTSQDLKRSTRLGYSVTAVVESH